MVSASEHPRVHPQAGFSSFVEVQFLQGQPNLPNSNGLALLKVMVLKLLELATGVLRYGPGKATYRAQDSKTLQL